MISPYFFRKIPPALRIHFQMGVSWARNICTAKVFGTYGQGASENSQPPVLSTPGRQCLIHTVPSASVWFSSVQSLSRVWLLATPWTAARQASLSITNSRSITKLTSIESVMPSNHGILCRPLLLPPPIPPSIMVISNELALRIRWPKYWSFSLNISPANGVHHF